MTASFSGISVVLRYPVPCQIFPRRDKNFSGAKFHGEQLVNFHDSSTYIAGYFFFFFFCYSVRVISVVYVADERPGETKDLISLVQPMLSISTIIFHRGRFPVV